MPKTLLKHHLFRNTVTNRAFGGISGSVNVRIMPAIRASASNLLRKIIGMIGGVMKTC